MRSFFHFLFTFAAALAFIGVLKPAFAAETDTRIARNILSAESYGQGIWYSARYSFRFHENLLASAGYSYIDVPPGSDTGNTASFHIVPVSLSALWQPANAQLPLYAELLFGGNAVIGGGRTDRTGVRATVTGQAFTPVIGLGAAYLPVSGGIILRATLYIFQGIDSIGIESRRLPWLGGSIGYAF